VSKESLHQIQCYYVSVKVLKYCSQRYMYIFYARKWRRHAVS